MGKGSLRKKKVAAVPKLLFLVAVDTVWLEETRYILKQRLGLPQGTMSLTSRKY